MDGSTERHASEVPSVPMSSAAISTPEKRRESMLAVAPGMIISAVIIRNPTRRTQMQITSEIMTSSSVLMSRVRTPLMRAISSSRVVYRN